MNRREFLALGPAFPASAVSASIVLREEGKEPIELGLNVLRLEKGDTVVLTASSHITKHVAERLKGFIEDRLPGVKAFILGDGLTVSGVLRGPE